MPCRSCVPAHWPLSKRNESASACWDIALARIGGVTKRPRTAIGIKGNQSWCIIIIFNHVCDFVAAGQGMSKTQPVVQERT